MALTLGTNSGFVTTAPTADPAGGDTTIDGSSVVTKHTTPATARRITQIGWYRGSGTNSANFEIALYADTAGVAAARLFVDATNSSSSGGWITTAVDWAVSPSTAYWLGLQMDAHGGSSTVDSATSGGAGIDVQTSQTTLADPYGGGAVSDADGMYAIYALVELQPALTQAEAAFYEDGTEAGASVIDSGADSINRNLTGGDSNMQLRLRLQETAGGVGLSTDDYQLQYEVNDSGTYLNVNQPNTTIVDESTGFQSNNFVRGGTGSSSETGQQCGQSFTTTQSYYIAQIKLSAWKVGSPTDNLYIEIASGSITGTTLATSDQPDISGLGSAAPGTDVTFTFSSPVSLSNATKYYFRVLRTNGSYDSTNYWNLSRSTSSTYTGGGEFTKSNNAWGSESATLDLSFRTYAGSPHVPSFNSGSLTDGNATTNRLGAGSGSFVAGKISEDGLVDDLAITASNYTELLYSLTIESTAVADTDTLDFRVLRNGATTGMTYTVTPRITIELPTDDHILASQDSAISLSIDNTTITQNHVIQPQDLALALTEDNTTLTQTNFVLTAQDVALSLTEDNATITQNHIIVTNDAAISLTEDNTTIDQTNFILTVQDLAIALTEDDTTVDQTNFVLTVQDMALGLTEDNTTLAQNHVIPVSDMALALSEDNITIQLNHTLTIQDIGLSLTEDNSTITQNHIMASQDIAISLTTDNTTFTQLHIIAVSDIIISLSEDVATISQLHILVASDMALSLTEDTTTISQNHTLTGQDIALSLTEDSTSVVVLSTIAPSDISLSLFIDSLSISVDQPVINYRILRGPRNKIRNPKGNIPSFVNKKLPRMIDRPPRPRRSPRT